MLTSLALLHPGHGTTQPGSIVHYLVEPVHAVSIVLGLVVLVAAAAALWAIALRKPSKR